MVMMKHFTTLLLTLSLSLLAHSIETEINYDSFLKQHDMVWDQTPHRWEVAPYSGNGNIGFLFYKHPSDPANAISLHLGRHDYYDHRLPVGDQDYLWIYRGRLPLGRFQITFDGEISATDLRLSLYRAELTGKITTSKGAVTLQALTHSTSDAVYMHTQATDESVSYKWVPEVPYSSSRKTLDSGGGPKGGTWDEMRKAPYPLPPEPTLGTASGVAYCQQILHDHRGETTTTYHVEGDSTGSQTLLASVHHSFPEKNSREIAVANITSAQSALTDKTFLAEHYQWWAEYYPLSFITLNDPQKEAFYWIQIYKLGSAMRENGPILDLMGPWYHYTFWPMVWGDLNVQLQYWTHLTSNRISLGASLPNNIDKYAANLLKNTPEHWQDSAAISTCFPQDMLGNNSGKNPDMLAWILHNYWLHCTYDADQKRLKENFFPVLRQTMNSYLNWLSDSKAETVGGVLKLPKSWSPEYPGPWDHNCNFTNGLMRWTAQTLVDLNSQHGLDDPLAPKWQELLDTLPEFEIDTDGLRIAENTPFEKPHRHYSHLLPFYPLAVLTPDTPESKQLLKTSLDHWLKVSTSGVEVQAMPVTGYTATGAASMYAWLQDHEKASYYLDFLIKHKNVSPTTMYAEGNPVIESPLSFCTSLHDMLLQSWDRKIRVLPACPQEWPDLAFHQLRTQGAFLVSAKRKGGQTLFVQVESLAGATCRIQTDIPSPAITINGIPVEAPTDKHGLIMLDLKKGEVALLSAKELSPDELTISPIPVPADKQNQFGYSQRSSALPGHKFYSPPGRK